MYTLIIEDKNGVIADEFSFSEGTYLIGRVDGNDIILPSSNVSRQHAKLFVRDDSCFVQDLGSSNGVIVDGQRIQGERDLGSAAQIRIGDYYLYMEFNRDRDDSQDVLSTHIVSQDEDAYKLVRVGDRFAGEVFPLDERRNTIGRTEDNTIFLNDPSVSRGHAEIECDGIIYRLTDLGSSNGTSVGGRRITGPTILRERDRVGFGNVDFIFAPSGEDVDVRKYAGHASSPGIAGGIGIGVIIAGLLILVMFGMGILFAGVAGWFLYKGHQATVVAPPVVIEMSESQKGDALVTDGVALMSQKQWSDAIEKFDEALTLDLNNKRAKSEREKALRERDAQEKFEAGLKLKGAEQYDSARIKLETVPEGTVASEVAARELDEVRQILANQQKKAAREAADRGEYGTARDKYIRALELVCDRKRVDQKSTLEGLKEKIVALERKMKRQRRYRNLEPYEVKRECR
jgi:pSer/pThr/pTyr-binding forkhead associated (FHA) protein